jgi:hypothetical protein
MSLIGHPGIKMIAGVIAVAIAFLVVRFQLDWSSVARDVANPRHVAALLILSFVVAAWLPVFSRPSGGIRKTPVPRKGDGGPD